MKTRMILAALLLMAFGTVKAQETLIPTPDGDGSKINTIVLKGSGTLKLRQGDKLTMNVVGSSVQYRVEDSVLYLMGSGSREVTIPNLSYLEISVGASSVQMKSGALRGKNLSIKKMGSSGIVDLLVDYDNVYVRSIGGNVTLSGKCNVFCSEILGKGRVDASKLDYKAKVEKSGDRWNMAFNLDDSSDKESLQNMVKEAQPFFEAETCRSDSWNRMAGDKSSYEALDTLQLKELMRELGENLQMLSDSVDWEKFEQDMERWGADMEKWGKKMEKWGEHMEEKYGKGYEYHYDYQYNRPEPKKEDSKKKEEAKESRPLKKNLLLDAHWAGFEAGLNMPFSTPSGSQMLDTRPMRCWYFGLNIVDVGIAFERRHIAGLFTGIGIGWSNYSWNNNAKVEMNYNPTDAVYSLVPINSDKAVKNTKYGALFLQVPLMLEIRPMRHMYIDAGVTGGLRIAQWNRVRFADRSQYKYYYNGANQFKLDASFRIGGENIGFFADYALLPLFTMANMEVHPLIFGVSLVF